MTYIKNSFLNLDYPKKIRFLKCQIMINSTLRGTGTEGKNYGPKIGPTDDISLMPQNSHKQDFSQVKACKIAFSQQVYPIWD